MQQMRNPQMSSRGTAVKYGLLLGVILGVLAGILLLLQANLSGCILVIVYYVPFGFIAGFLASKQTGKASTGALAGLLTGLFGSLIFTAVETIQHNGFSAAYLAGIVIVCILTCIGGTVGGVIGKNRRQSPVTQAPRPEGITRVPELEWNVPALVKSAAEGLVRSAKQNPTEDLSDPRDGWRTPPSGLTATARYMPNKREFEVKKADGSIRHQQSASDVEWILRGEWLETELKNLRPYSEDWKRVVERLEIFADIYSQE